MARLSRYGLRSADFWLHRSFSPFLKGLFLKSHILIFFPERPFCTLSCQYLYSSRDCIPLRWGKSTKPLLTSFAALLLIDMVLLMPKVSGWVPACWITILSNLNVPKDTGVLSERMRQKQVSATRMFTFNVRPPADETKSRHKNEKTLRSEQRRHSRPYKEISLSCRYIGANMFLFRSLTKVSIQPWVTNNKSLFSNSKSLPKVTPNGWVSYPSGWSFYFCTTVVPHKVKIWAIDVCNTFQRLLPIQENILFLHQQNNFWRSAKVFTRVAHINLTGRRVTFDVGLYLESQALDQLCKKIVIFQSICSVYIMFLISIRSIWCNNKFVGSGILGLIINKKEG